MYLIYFLIGFIATVLGAAAGLGGGIIIKPVLDFWGQSSLELIGFLSAVTVFSMASVSLLRTKKRTIKIEKKQSLMIAFGSIAGGFIGKGLFTILVNHLLPTRIVGLIQSILLIGILLIIVLFIKFRLYVKTYQIKNKLVIFSVGLALGVISAFIGIGGGPLNVAILGWLFSMNTKQAAYHSIFIIFFSQLSAIIITLLTDDILLYDLSMLPVMVLGGIVGGIVGSRLSERLSSLHVEYIFNTVIIIIIVINLINIFQFIQFQTS
ncbi:sulfite exporter TauE/SafE family protein [Amphibacillus cookii]|uniref:sulfite exporter TauE/SafE family protein n=1 Tax=Amphibacillus cookii TaxID=767787 RepID=UPI001958A0CE|nr:sulfite exporter TauE/SafE family protein [Amphibacillus cookii]MBM7542033.1 putative membrane protein YfcA [Amphibacillus cookii]